MYASLNNWRGSPRKFNEYLRVVRGVSALEAADRLKFMPSPYAHALSQLILSAVSNASNNASIVPGQLKIREATVGRAKFLKRVCFRGRGRMGRVTKFGCNVKVVLIDSNDINLKSSNVQTTAKKVSDNKVNFSDVKSDAKLAKKAQTKAKIISSKEKGVTNG